MSPRPKAGKIYDCFYGYFIAITLLDEATLANNDVIVLPNMFSLSQMVTERTTPVSSKSEPQSMKPIEGSQNTSLGPNMSIKDATITLIVYFKIYF